MTSKAERDHEIWNATPPQMPEGWTRYPLTSENRGIGAFWDVLPEGVEEDQVPLMVEYRPSIIMGYGMAAVWVGPKED